MVAPVDQDIREIVGVDTPSAFAAVEELPNSITIKGFVSVEGRDRSGDTVSPTEFNIKQFMTSPTLLVNHDFWMDDNGNAVSVGVVKLLTPVQLIARNDNLFDVQDLTSKQIINTFPADRIPNLSGGDKGLFVVAEVTQPDIVKKVKMGELSAFSWRGFSRVRLQADENQELRKHLEDIDLIEISLVDIPDNPNATFVVGKSIHVIKLDKSRFESDEEALTYLKAKNLKYDKVMQDDSSYFCRQTDGEYFDLDKLVVTKMAQGVHAIAGDLKKDAILKDINTQSKEEPWPWSWLSKKSIDAFLSLDQGKGLQETKMSEETSTATETSEVTETEQKKVEDTNKTTDTEKTTETEKKTDPNVEAMTQFQDAIVSKITKGLQPLFESLVSSNKAVAEAVSSFAKSVETPSKDKKTETEDKETDKTWDTLNELAKSLQATQEQVAEVAKSALAAEQKADAVASDTAEETKREEKVDTSKSKDSDKRAVMNSLFPFTK